jgi:hypothetical protein
MSLVALNCVTRRFTTTRRVADLNIAKTLFPFVTPVYLLESVERITVMSESSCCGKALGTSGNARQHSITVSRTGNFRAGLRSAGG